MSDITVIDPTTNKPIAEEAPTELKSENNISSPVTPELQERAIEQVMGLETDSDKGTYKHKVQTLLDYAKSQTKDHSPENLKWMIRSLELKLGNPPLAEKRVSYLARYAYLELEEQKIKQEKNQFERKI